MDIAAEQGTVLLVSPMFECVQFSVLGTCKCCDMWLLCLNVIIIAVVVIINEKWQNYKESL